MKLLEIETLVKPGQPGVLVIGTSSARAEWGPVQQSTGSMSVEKWKMTSGL